MITEAIKLALEALEDISSFKNHTSGDSSDVDKAITALREALAQPQQEPAAWFYRDNLGRPCSTTKKPLSPFKDMQPLYFGQEFVCSTGLCHYRKENT